MNTIATQDFALKSRLIDALCQISADKLQVLAEEMACIKLPSRFLARTLIRAGRNAESQTTKGWPDAYVVTAPGIVDGIEATREKQSWVKHLKDDLQKIDNPDYHSLSGYFFVGGYPKHAPTSEEIAGWVSSLSTKAKIDASQISILIGDDLVLELVRPEYARIRQTLLDIPLVPEWFRLLGEIAVTDHCLGPFQPTKMEFENGLVEGPALLADVLDDLERHGVCEVRGFGAAGKTTLAQLLSRSPNIASFPSWYVDLSSYEPHMAASLINELVMLAGNGVFFVVDNVHINEAFATQIVDAWKKSVKPLGSKLLLLGRQTSAVSKVTPVSPGCPLRILRAGFAEMLSVAKRLCARDGKPVPTFSSQILGDWAETFGGSRKPADMAVDLIAFTAAFYQRLPQITRGNFVLSPEDAVEAMRAKYLAPLKGSDELQNLQRLVALSEFEIGIPDELLVDAIEVFHTCMRTMGIVLEERTGLESRRSHKLFHSGLGGLLIKASPSLNVANIRVEMSADYPAIGLRMLAARSEFEGCESVKEAIANSIRSGQWIKGLGNLYDASNVIRVAIQKKYVTTEILDGQLNTNGVLRKAVDNTRDVIAVNSFVSLAVKRKLSQSLKTVQEVATSQRSIFHRSLYSSRAIELATLVRLLPGGESILSSIDYGIWDEQQKCVGADTADNVVSGTRTFERLGHEQLSRAPALRLIEMQDSNLWRHCDLGHLSHALRRAGYPDNSSQLLVNKLSDSGWVKTSISRGSVGQLSGALMSLANRLPLHLRSFILVDELEQRVLRELETPSTLEPKYALRPIGLIGGYRVLGGAFNREPQVDWNSYPSMETMFAAIRPENDQRILGMYELQFWSGLKALAEYGIAPNCVGEFEGERFLSILESTNAPTAHAKTIRDDLLAWLRVCKQNNWRLPRISRTALDTCQRQVD